MAADSVEEHRALYGRFLEPAIPEGDADDTHDVASPRPADLVKSDIHRVFQNRGDVERIALHVDGRFIGVATRASILSSEGSAAGGAFGDGDGLSFPLDSSEFRLITFVCPKPACACREFAAFYDARRIPTCRDHNVVMTIG